jgi:hypothetical protein
VLKAIVRFLHERLDKTGLTKAELLVIDALS